MSTGYALVDSPPVRAQSRPRREDVAGTVVVHVVAPGTGTWVPPQNVVTFIRNRPDPGSYHTIVSFDQAVKLLPPDVEAFQAETGSNRWAWSISFCCDPVTFDLSDDRTRRALRLAAHEIAEFAVGWDRVGARQVARWITGDQAQGRRAGMVEHWEVQPHNRSDMVRNHPERDAIRSLLLAYVTEAIDVLLDEPDDKPLTIEEAPMLVLNRQGHTFLLYPSGLIVEITAGEPPPLPTWEPHGAVWKKLVVVNEKERIARGLRQDEIKDSYR